MLIKVYGAAVQGIEAYVVTIEVNTSRGIKFFLVGLPDNAVRESHERIVSAFQNNGLKFPTNQIIINLAPADIRKEGASYDLPLAVGIMAASEMLPPDRLDETMLMGELGLDGRLHAIKGVLPIAIKARNEGFRRIVIPLQNAGEASAVEGIEVLGATGLGQVIGYLKDGVGLEPYRREVPLCDTAQNADGPDFAEVKGQQVAKRALEVAAAGGHNAILIGSPGSGKSMMAQRLPSILPPLTHEESLETTKIHSVAGLLKPGSPLISVRPFRSPHHTITTVALTGGGVNAQPGEISLAHNGVLFVDEMPEFSRQALESLRQPLEDHCISISRAKYNVTYPASFMLVASMNPCPCGYYTNPTRPCTCTPDMITRYMSRISGPLMDRIDIQVEVAPLQFGELSGGAKGESSSSIRERVIAARKIQTKRFSRHHGIHCNAQMTTAMANAFAKPDARGMQLLDNAMTRLNLSARAYNRILKLARTIADLDGSATVQAQHIAEAIGYRTLDRGDWAERRV